MTSTYRAGAVLEELLLCGVLVPEDIARAVHLDLGDDVDDVEAVVEGDVVRVGFGD